MHFSSTDYVLLLSALLKRNHVSALTVNPLMNLHLDKSYCKIQLQGHHPPLDNTNSV